MVSVLKQVNTYGDQLNHNTTWMHWKTHQFNLEQLLMVNSTHASVSGIVYCYDIQTGELLWNYEVTDPYQEILWANNLVG